MFKIRFLIFTFLIFFAALVLVLFSKNQTLSLSNIAFPFLEKDYQLEPANNYFSAPAKYQLVNITNNPSDFRYFRQYYRELDAIFNHPENINVYLNDRISQTLQWGNELNLNKDITSAKQLANWWQKNKPHFWEFYAKNKFNTWESILAQYQYLSLDYLLYLLLY